MAFTPTQTFFGVQGASALMSALGAARDSESKKQSLEYQAAIAEMNARIANIQAEDAIDRGKEDADRNRRGTTNTKSSIKAALGSSGFRSDSGDAVNLLVSADVIGLAEEGIILDNAEKEAWSRRVQASNFEADSSVLNARAKAENPALAGATSLLGSGLSVAGKWYASKI